MKYGVEWLLKCPVPVHRGLWNICYTFSNWSDVCFWKTNSSSYQTFNISSYTITFEFFFSTADYNWNTILTGNCTQFKHRSYHHYDSNVWNKEAVLLRVALHVYLGVHASLDLALAGHLTTLGSRHVTSYLTLLWSHEHWGWCTIHSLFTTSTFSLW